MEDVSSCNQNDSYNGDLSPPSEPGNILQHRPPDGHPMVTHLYDSLEDLENALVNWAFESGFAITRQSPSNKRPGTNDYTWYTFKVGCPWTATIKCLKRNDWKWSLDIKPECRHVGHGAFESPASLAHLRQLTPAMKELIATMSEPPAKQCRKICAALRDKFPDAIFAPKDVDNYQQVLRRQALGK